MQPLNPAQLGPQSGAISIANTVAMATVLKCARPLPRLSFGILILNPINATPMNTRRQCGLHFVAVGVHKDSNPFLPNTREGMDSVYLQLRIRAAYLLAWFWSTCRAKRFPPG
jgi:hypothetical protein